MRDPRPKSLHIMCFHVYDISGRSNAIKTEHKLLVTKSGRTGEQVATALRLQGFPVGGSKGFGTRQRQWLYHIVNVLNATDLGPFKWLKWSILLGEFFLNWRKQADGEQGGVLSRGGTGCGLRFNWTILATVWTVSWREQGWQPGAAYEAVGSGLGEQWLGQVVAVEVVEGAGVCTYLAGRWSCMTCW